MIQDPKLQQQLAIISENYSSLREAITRLQIAGLPLKDSLSLVEHVRESLSDSPGPEGIKIRNKLDDVLLKNNGFNFLTKVRNVLNGGEGAEEVFEHYTVDELLLFTFAPITSCDVERGFSMLKSIFSDRRRRLLLPNLSALLSISLNRGINSVQQIKLKKLKIGLYSTQ